MRKFKVGDRFVCPCGMDSCVKSYTVSEIYDFGILALDANSISHRFNNDDIGILEHEAVYESPLYEELK